MGRRFVRPTPSSREARGLRSPPLRRPSKIIPRVIAASEPAGRDPPSSSSGLQARRRQTLPDDESSAGPRRHPPRSARRIHSNSPTYGLTPREHVARILGRLLPRPAPAALQSTPSLAERAHCRLPTSASTTATMTRLPDTSLPPDATPSSTATPHSGPGNDPLHKGPALVKPRHALRGPRDGIRHLSPSLAATSLRALPRLQPGRSPRDGMTATPLSGSPPPQPRPILFPVGHCAEEGPEVIARHFTAAWSLLGLRSAGHVTTEEEPPRAVIARPPVG